MDKEREMQPNEAWETGFVYSWAAFTFNMTVLATPIHKLWLYIQPFIPFQFIFNKILATFQQKHKTYL